MWKIPLSDVDLGTEEREAAIRVIDSGWLTLGPEVAAFETEFAASCGGDSAVAVSSGTAALHLACVALGVGPGDEVIVPSLTFVASANAIALAGGRPVFCDSTGHQDFSLDPADVERKLSKATRGVMCVHYGGYACQMDALVALCEQHGLFLIEDVAHAPGAMWKGSRLGTIGDVGCFSFFGNKNMTTGEGGMTLAKSPDVSQQIRLLRSHGMTSMSWDRFHGHARDYDVVALGYNYRPSELTAALGRPQLAKLHSNNARRAALVDRYRERLRGSRGLELPYLDREGAAHLCVLLLATRQQRDGLRRALASGSIQTSLHYPPAHLFEHYRSTYGCRAGDLPVAEDLAQRCITVPLYPTMSVEQVDDVCDHILLFLQDGPPP